MVRPRVFLDFSFNDKTGRVVIELFNDTAPRTCENFRALCTGEKGLSAAGNPLYYKNSIIHRSIKNFMVQGGDFTRRNGTGGESIYGGTFKDEDLTRPLDSEGLVCMANKGPDTNGSQFFITLRDCPHLNGKHVVFGRIMHGYEDVIRKIAEMPVDEKNRPLSPVVITGCGELELRKPLVKQVKLDGDGLNQRSPSTVSQDAPEHHAKRSKRRSSSRLSYSSTSSSEHLPRRKNKKAKQHDAEENGIPKMKAPSLQAPETEEEYDARLEREEKEQLEAQRRNELERIRCRCGGQTRINEDGVRYKGRGRMKFIDPEGSQKRS